METISFALDGRDVAVAAEPARSLLDALRGAGVRSAKDGCAPQGQCGCCTVLVDGEPRVACVTPLRRVAGRAVTTFDGLGAAAITMWSDALVCTGGSQCGFCTPGIVVRLEWLRARGSLGDVSAVQRALAAHLCRCTGWQSIEEAAGLVSAGTPVHLAGRDVAAAERRAGLEGGTPQQVGPQVVAGRGGFAVDTAPAGALVALVGSDGEWVVGESWAEARAASGKVQGRATTVDARAPLDVPPGDWALTLRTGWVEPAYLEVDASWCEPGGDPVSPLPNGGAFGGKSSSPVPAAARELADRHGRAVLAAWTREDVARWGPKRPPVALGVDRAGSGVLRVARTPGVVDAIAAVAPALRVEEVDVVGPATSTALRGAGWLEAVVATAAVTGAQWVRSPAGAEAAATVEPDGTVTVRVRCGTGLDPVVLRSYCVGAAHMALGWVVSESLAVDADGRVLDLTVRSFGILRAMDLPRIEVELVESDDEPVNGSDAVLAAVALAVWRAQGLPPQWPTGVALLP